MQARKINVKGKVQGVFFRASTQEKARELGLFGWCRNEANGTVSIHAEGTLQKLDTFVNWCYHGPKLANVTEVQVKNIEPEGFVGFEIRR